MAIDRGDGERHHEPWTSLQRGGDERAPCVIAETSVESLGPSKLDRIGQVAGQTTSTTKVRRVDFGDCGPLNTPFLSPPGVSDVWFRAGVRPPGPFSAKSSPFMPNCRSAQAESRHMPNRSTALEARLLVDSPSYAWHLACLCRGRYEARQVTLRIEERSDGHRTILRLSGRTAVLRPPRDAQRTAGTGAVVRGPVGSSAWCLVRS